MKKLYEDQDINDIIEAEEEAFFKGGVGSGQKGHVTYHPTPDYHKTSKKVVGHTVIIREDGKNVGHHTSRFTDPKQAESEARASRERVRKSEDINDLIEEEFFKGRGPDKQKRKSRSSNATADKMAEINAHFGDNMEQSVKNYLSQEHKIGSWAHSVRVNDVHSRVLRERAKKQS